MERANLGAQPAEAVGCQGEKCGDIPGAMRGMEVLARRRRGTAEGGEAKDEQFPVLFALAPRLSASLCENGVPQFPCAGAPECAKLARKFG